MPKLTHHRRSPAHLCRSRRCLPQPIALVFRRSQLLKMDFQAFSFSFVGWLLGHMPNVYDVCHPLDDCKNGFQGEKDHI
ncbi:hypothetical protein CMV_024257 [Castanea mollissima]|uniref:Uncharacterized protein n=1 Tax=Castanea mollissima TaxID=60419 RepID=A0A8J4QN43_9ROSI|nr:hypothetical protein CMV_024257 [Castanea mollissima]